MHPSKHKPFEHLYIICTMLDQRLGRSTDVMQILYKCFVAARICRDGTRFNMVREISHCTWFITWFRFFFIICEKNRWFTFSNICYRNNNT